MAAKKINSSLVEISDLFLDIVPGKRWKIFYPRRIIWQKWSEIVGEAIAKVALPLYFKNTDGLVVAVIDNMWMQQLSYEKKMILKKINKLLPPYSHLKEIYFRIDNISSLKKSRDNSLKKHKKNISNFSPSLFSDAEIKALEKIHDQELKKSFQRLFTYITYKAET